MARKSIIVLTSTVGLVAVAAGAYIARHRRDGYTAGTAKAKPVPADWRHSDDLLTEEFAHVIQEESVSAVGRSYRLVLHRNGPGGGARAVFMPEVAGDE
jgi:hypothetical protein